MLQQIKIKNKSLWVDLCERINVCPKTFAIQEIGNGYFAQAYALPNNKVLKVTNDKTDALGLRYFQKNPSEFIVKVHDIFKIEIEGADVFFVVVDKLRPLTNVWYSFLDELSLQSGNVSLMIAKLKNASSAYNRKHKVKKKWLEDLHRYFSDRGFRILDFHEGNAMRKGRHQVQVIDLGLSFGYPKINISRLNENEF